MLPTFSLKKLNNFCDFADKADSADEASTKKPRLETSSYYYILDSESPIPTSEDEESIYSFQGFETGQFLWVRVVLVKEHNRTKFGETLV